ncbi:BQ2448_4879 [Microbotryum intermedium]|uniref:BQ2448_4879 protein n=1 Tax=Microbotryum intermedium TaxID=269621 RepID=A0A238FG63_9BASI|nr:BQ2448_4879 [Microbotryum intermedium]
MGGPHQQTHLNIQDDHSLSYTAPTQRRDLSPTHNGVAGPGSSRLVEPFGTPINPSTQTGRQIASRAVYRDTRGVVDGADLVAARTADSVSSSRSDDEGPTLLQADHSGSESHDKNGKDVEKSRKKGKSRAEVSHDSDGHFDSQSAAHVSRVFVARLGFNFEQAPQSNPNPKRRIRVIESSDDEDESHQSPPPSTKIRPPTSPSKANLAAEGRERLRSTSLFDCVLVDNSRLLSPTKRAGPSSLSSSPMKVPRLVTLSPSKNGPVETLVLSSSGSGTENPDDDDMNEEEDDRSRSRPNREMYLFDSEAEEASDSSSGRSEAVLKSRPTPKDSNKKTVVRSDSDTQSETEEEDGLPLHSNLASSTRRAQPKVTPSSRKRRLSTTSSDISGDSVGHRRSITSVARPRKRKASQPSSTTSRRRRRSSPTTPALKRKSVKEVARKQERKRSDDEESENESDEAFIVDDERVRSTSRKPKKKTDRGFSKKKKKKAKRASKQSPISSSGSDSHSQSDDNGSDQHHDDETNSEDEDDLELSGEETLLPDDARRGSSKISKFAQLRAERERKRYENVRRKRMVIDSDNDEPASTHHAPRSYLGASDEEIEDADGDTNGDENESTHGDQTTDLDADVPGFIVEEDEDDQSETDRALVEDIRRRTIGKSQGPMYYFKAFLSWIVRSIIAPDIDWLADEEMLEAHNKVHEIYQDHLNSLLGSSAWTPVFRAAIKTRPIFVLHEIDDALRATPCDACVMGRHRASIFRAELSGEAYDQRSLAPLTRKGRKKLLHQLALEDDNHNASALKLLVNPEQMLDFNLGKFCASRSHTYHELHHRPFSAKLELETALRGVRRKVEVVEAGKGRSERQRKDEWERRIGREAERCVQVLEEQKVTTRLTLGWDVSRKLAKSMQDELSTATRLFATSG